MALRINNKEVDRLLEQIIQLSGESKTEALRVALAERYQRLLLLKGQPRSEARLLAFLENEIWPQIPPHVLGTTLTKAEEEAILGYDDLDSLDGVG